MLSLQGVLLVLVVRMSVVLLRVADRMLLEMPIGRGESMEPVAQQSRSQRHQVEELTRYDCQSSSCPCYPMSQAQA